MTLVISLPLMLAASVSNAVFVPGRVFSCTGTNLDGTPVSLVARLEGGTKRATLLVIGKDGWPFGSATRHTFKVSGIVNNFDLSADGKPDWVYWTITDMSDKPNSSFEFGFETPLSLASARPTKFRFRSTSKRYGQFDWSDTVQMICKPDASGSDGVPSKLSKAH